MADIVVGQRWRYKAGDDGLHFIAEVQADRTATMGGIVKARILQRISLNERFYVAGSEHDFHQFPFDTDYTNGYSSNWSYLPGQDKPKP